MIPSLINPFQMKQKTKQVLMKSWHRCVPFSLGGSHKGVLVTHRAEMQGYALISRGLFSCPWPHMTFNGNKSILTSMSTQAGTAYIKSVEHNVPISSKHLAHALSSPLLWHSCWKENRGLSVSIFHGSHLEMNFKGDVASQCHDDVG